MSIPQRVKVVEVGPRDGLQNEPVTASTGEKIELIDRLADAGLTVIESGSFVSPKWVPKMSDSAAVLAGITRRPGVSYPVLVPNMKGLEAALEADVAEIAVFGAASETFSRKNINCSIAESLDRFAGVCAAALARGLRVRGYVSCVLGCPYEGTVDSATVAHVSRRLLELGCYEISLGDTIGIGTPRLAQAVVDKVAETVPREKLAVHFHDTYGQALANILACLERGITVIDSSVAGLGGCPYAKGATGNVATEDVLYMLDGMGIETGIDLAALASAGRFISGVLGRPPASRVAQALAAREPGADSGG